MKPTQQQFAAVCYLVLMSHHGKGIEEAHPSYVSEKLSMLEAGYDAFGRLDSENQTRVFNYLAKWGFEMPEEIVEN